MGASTKKKSKSRPTQRRRVVDQPPAPVQPAETAGGTLRWASWLVFAECVGLAAVLIYIIYADANQDRATTKSAILVTMYAAIFVLALAMIARGLRNRKQWSRGPAIALHLMLVPLGWYMVAAGLWGAGVPIILLGIGGFVLLVLPSTRAELNIR